MSNHVKKKIRQNKPNKEWDDFLKGLKSRLHFHETKAAEARLLIADLEKLREEGVALPVAKHKTAGTAEESIPA